MEQIAHGLLIVAHLWIYFPIGRLGEYSPTAAEFIRDAVIFGQVGLIAVWIVLGPRSPTLWVAIPYATAIGAWLPSRGPAAEIDRVLARMLAIEAVAIFAVLGLARQCGLQIARRGAPAPFALRFQAALVGGTLAVVRSCDYRLAFQLRAFRSAAWPCGGTLQTETGARPLGDLWNG
jgi:hypothetical protein